MFICRAKCRGKLADNDDNDDDDDADDDDDDDEDDDDDIMRKQVASKQSVTSGSCKAN